MPLWNASPTPKAMRTLHCRHPVLTVFTVEGGAGVGSLAIGIVVAVIVLQHAEHGKLVQELVQALVVRGIMLLCIHLMQQGV